MKFRNVLLIALLSSATLLPMPSQANEVCVNGICTKTFQYTGSHQTWAVPTGITEIQVRLYGAAGGRGGAGGSVTATVRNLPSQIFIFVGGRGIEGANVAGGFNGGGATAGARGNEGSGGGASDIRFGLSLNERVVVAGGGGGSGGFAGAMGGAGGGLVGEWGGSGQAGGGQGGSQTGGGNPGYSNGGSAGTAGSFGQGGRGGFSYNAGGGGGGGGWYGGGGGGADDDSCCSDGGGGGGGSSYASAQHTLNVQHQTGVNSGDGRIEISYKQLLTVTSFTGSQVSASVIEFNLTISDVITGLQQHDFQVSDSNCTIDKIQIDANSARVELKSCVDDLVSLTLLANSLADGTKGPGVATTASVNFDTVAPDFTWLQSPELFSEAAFSLGFSLTDGQVVVDNFDLGTCLGEIQEGELVISYCPDGQHQIKLLKNQLSDNWGNTGPAQDVALAFEVDTLPPMAWWSEVEVSNTKPETFSSTLTFSEWVDFDPAAVEFKTDQDCQSSYQAAPMGWTYSATCGYAQVEWMLPVDSLVDRAGHSGPGTAVVASFALVKPAPEVLPVVIPPAVIPTEQSSEQPAPSIELPAVIAPVEIVGPIIQDEITPAPLEVEIVDESTSPTRTEEAVEEQLPEVSEQFLSDEVISDEVISKQLPSLAETREDLNFSLAMLGLLAMLILGVGVRILLSGK